MLRPKCLSACDAQAGRMLVNQDGTKKKNQGKKYSVNEIRKLAFDVYPICPQHDSSIRLDV
jgi:hypothetical protein